jgi:hypothetical protein
MGDDCVLLLFLLLLLCGLWLCAYVYFPVYFDIIIMFSGYQHVLLKLYITNVEVSPVWACYARKSV